MPRSSTLAAVEIDVAEQPELVLQVEPDSSFRILVAADFSGGAGRNRRPVLVDRDNFDEVLGLFAPELHLPVAGKMRTLRFRELEDFHPDRLAAQLPEPEEIRPASTDPARPGAPPSNAELLNRIVERDEPRPAPANGDGGGDDLVAPYTASGAAPAEIGRVSARAALLTAQMRAVMHHPDFQALESAWRGLHFLVKRLETGEAIQIYAMDLPQEALANPSGLMDLQRAAVEESSAAAGGEAWSVIAGLYRFGANEESVLTQIAALARRAGAPFLSGVVSDAADLEQVFTELRRSVDARWVGLALPRFLLRLPYGKETAPIDSFTFEEMPLPPERQRYLWGHAAIACAYLLGEAFSQYGSAMRPGMVNEIAELPAHAYRTNGQLELTPSTEVALTREAAAMLAKRGFIPLVSVKGTDYIRVTRFQSIAEPAAPLAGRWS